MNSEITIRMLAPAPNNNCRPVRSHLGEKCSNLATYTVSLNSNGSGTGANVCAKHLFEAVAYYVGLPGVIT
jgi:hypothetical protein